MSKEKSLISKGFLFSSIFIIAIFAAAIWYMQSNMSLPPHVNMGTDEFIKNLDKELADKNKAAVSDLEPLAQQGDVQAQVKLAWLYRISRDPEKIKKSFILIKKAADSGDAHAGSQLGYYYECGIGTKINLAEAIKWYTPAAEQGDVLTQYALAEIEKDPKKKKYWWGKVQEAMKECPSCDLPPGGCA